MGRKAVDMQGFKRGKIEVIQEAGINKSGNILWKYRCSCGNVKVATAHDIKKKDSCGCIGRKEKSINMRNKNTTHGESRTRLYIVWGNMINRTTNETAKDYEQYGGRGITVCEEWKDFPTFKKWALENGYKENLTLDRIDNDKKYSPSNCRWADWDTQNNNKQQSRKLTYKGETKTVEQWAKEKDINRSTLINRLNRGMSTKETLETPIKGGKGIGYKPKKKKK